MRKNPIKTRFFSGCFVTLIACNAYAQTTEIRQYELTKNGSNERIDTKSYTIESIPESDEYVMAETIFEENHFENGNPNTQIGKGIHFMKLDATGAVLTSVFYDDPNYIDERVIDVAPRNANETFILIQLRDQNDYWRGKMKILCVDNNSGNILTIAGQYQDVIADYASFEESIGDIYPMNSLYDGSTDRLYICGYVRGRLSSAQSPAGDNYFDIYTPNFHSKYTGPIWSPHIPSQNVYNGKGIFFSYYDPTTATVNINNGIDIYYPPSFTNYDTSFGNFSIGLRMKKLSDGDIMVLGSCNNITADGRNGSGTFVMKASTTTLAGPIVILRDYSLNADQNEEDIYEYGFDVIEGNTAGADGDHGYFVFSNKFSHIIDPNTPADKWTLFGGTNNGYYFFSTYPMVSYLPSDAFSHEGSVTDYISSRIHIYPSSYPDPLLFAPYGNGGQPLSGGWSWGSKLLKSNRSVNGHDDWATVVLSGLNGYYETNDQYACYHSNGSEPVNNSGFKAPLASNILPFLSDMELRWDNNTGIGIQLNFWKNYHVQHQYSAPLYLLGGGLSNMSWHNVFSADKTSNSDIAFLSSAEGHSGSGFSYATKFTRTDNNGNITSHTYGCDTTYIDCQPVNKRIVAYTDMASQMQIEFTGLPVSTIGGSSIMDASYLSYDDNHKCSNSGYFKTTTVENIDKNGEIGMTIYPNPTTDFVTINISGNVSAETNVKISLADISGKEIACIYKGIGGNIYNKRIPLPFVSPGVYLLKGIYGNHVLNQQKLIIR